MDVQFVGQFSNSIFALWPLKPIFRLQDILATRIAGAKGLNIMTTKSQPISFTDGIRSQLQL